MPKPCSLQVSSKLAAIAYRATFLLQTKYGCAALHRSFRLAEYKACGNRPKRWTRANASLVWWAQVVIGRMIRVCWLEGRGFSRHICMAAFVRQGKQEEADCKSWWSFLLRLIVTPVREQCLREERQALPKPVEVEGRSLNSAKAKDIDEEVAGRSGVGGQARYMI